MKKKYLILAVIGAFLSHDSSYATSYISNIQKIRQQDSSVSGKVTDKNGSPIAGVKVSIKGGSNSVTTNKDGIYNISAQQDDILVFSAHKFQLYEEQVKTDRLDVSLDESVPPKDTVEILYGKHKTKTFSGASASIKGEEIRTVSSPMTSNALAGRLLGLIATQSISLGNDGSNFSIRNQSPVIMVDGAIRDIDQVNVNEIESITVLKDPVSLAPLGMRSSGGIIMVKTKQGSDSEQLVNFTTQLAIQQPTYLPNYLGSYDYALLSNEASKNDGNPAIYSPAEIEGYRTGQNPYLYPNVNWYKEALKPSYYYTRHNLNVSGGNKTARYFISLENLKQDGIFKSGPNDYDTNNGSKRNSFRSNVEIDIDKNLTVGLGIAGRYEKLNSPGTDVNALFSSMKNTPPNAYPVLNPNGSLGGNSLYQRNIRGLLYSTGYSLENRRTLFVDADINRKLNSITEGLSLTGSVHYSSYYSNTVNKSRSAFAVYQLIIDPVTQAQTYRQFNSDGTFSSSDSYGDVTRRLNYDAGLAYNRSFNKHSVDATLRYTWDQYDISSNNDNTVPLTHAYQGLMGRVSYDYNEKYFADFAFSYQGTEQYPKGDRFGFFPAISAGYDISKEDFFKVASINQLKLKVSAGLLGFDRASYFATQPYYTPGSGYVFGASGTGLNGWNEQTLGNPNITWEKSRAINAGIDARFFNSKLGVNLEYFNNRQYDVLQTRGASNPILGITYPVENIGEYEYNGIELGSDYNFNIGKMGVTLMANTQFFANKVIFTDELPRQYSYQERTGGRIGQPFGLVALGLFQSQAEINASPGQFFANLQPGDIKYKDVNSDGVINDDDQTAIGKKSSPINYSGSIGLKYEGFDFSVLVQGVANKDFFYTGSNAWAFQTNGLVNTGVQPHHLGRWTPETAATATYPRLSYGTNVNNDRTSTYWIKDGDYLRVKNIEIGYTLPSDFMKRIHLSEFRVYANAFNAFTFTKLEDLDPESLFSNYPLYKSFSLGISIKF
ncbi:SusC/RagA family TonB-linked outer membrane protein [Flavobacterium fluvii]|nr:TonB-dependent receptor [Flavobacterium fluvii]